MWDSSPKHFVAKNCLKDYFWSQILLLSARRGRPRRERSQHLRKQIVRYGLFWMGADDCVSEKIQTRAGHIYLRQSLPAAGIIEESESARGERGRVGQGRVGFRV